MKPSIIIVEGPDNCGKTHLSKALANRFNANYWHMTSGPGLDDHRAMARYQLDAWSNAKENLRNGRTTVFDRFWPSDQVYGSILRDRPSLDFKMMIELSIETGALFIFCDRYKADEHYLTNVDQDHPYDVGVYNQLVAGYRDLAERIDHYCEVIGYQLDNFIERDGQLNAFFEGLNMR